MYSLTLLDVLKNHGNSMISGNVKNDSIVQNQDYGSQRVDYFFDHDEALKGIMSKEFKCPISLKVMYDPVFIDMRKHLKECGYTNGFYK